MSLLESGLAELLKELDLEFWLSEGSRDKDSKYELG